MNNQEKQGKLETTIIVRRIPVDVLRAFKHTCLEEGVSMQKKIAELMRSASAHTVVTTKSDTVYNLDEKQ